MSHNSENMQFLILLCCLRSIATHGDHFVRRLSVLPSVTLPEQCFAGDTCIHRNAATIFSIFVSTLQGLTNRFFRYLPKDRLEYENHLPYHKSYLPYLDKDKIYYLVKSFNLTILNMWKICKVKSCLHFEIQVFIIDGIYFNNSIGRGRYRHHLCCLNPT